MFRSIFLKTLRDYRVAILGWGIGMGLVIVSPMASVATLLSTPAQRAALVGLAAQFAWNADPVAADTIGGYATFKIGVFVFLICVWPLLAASRMLRGEEDRGSLDVLLSVPRSRVSVAVQKLAAMWVALLAMGAIIGVLAYLGGRAFKGEFGFGDTMLLGLDVALICAVFGGIALLVSQFTSERGPAAGITGGLLLVFIAVDMVHRVVPNTDWFSHLSPIYYYNLSKPLIPSYGTSVGGLLVLAALTLVTSGAAVWLFARRDVGAAVRLPRWLQLPRRAAGPSRTLPTTDWSLRSVYTRSLGMIAPATFWWTLGFAAWAAWEIVVVHQLAGQLNKVLANGPGGRALQVLQTIGGKGTTLDTILLGALFELMPVLLMVFAVTQVNGWSSDQDDGRLEIVLSTAHARVAVLLGRFAALATATVVLGVATLLASAAAVAVSGVSLDGANLVGAVAGMIPLGLLIAAIGYLFAGWLRTAADTGLLSLLLAAWFFISFVGPDLKWPDSALQLSAFYYYGTPLLHGLDLVKIAVVVGVGVLALALASLRFARRDIAA